MAKIKTFELDRWSEPDEKRRVRHIGMADAKETFDRLQTHLELKGLLPDEYFLFSDELTGELPEFDQALCIPNFGASEGIYLLNSALEKIDRIAFAKVQTITCHGKDDYSLWLAEIPKDMLHSILREACERVGTLDELMGAMNPKDGYEMRLFIQTPGRQFAFYRIPERLSNLEDYANEGCSVRGTKDEIMAEIFTEWAPAQEDLEDDFEL